MAKMNEAIDLLKKRADRAVMVEDGTRYTKVQDRVEVFREIWGEELGVITEILSSPPYHKGDIFIMKASIVRVAGANTALSTGHAMEIIASDSFTSTAFVEVAETSAIGRALAAFGLHGGEYASAEEIENVPNKQRALAESQQPDAASELGRTLSSGATTDITTKRIVLDDYDKPLSKRDAEFVCKTLIAAGALAKNMGELSAYWSNNEKVIDLLKDSDIHLHSQVIDFFKEVQAKWKGEKYAQTI